jgi:hypothetical protein
MQRQLARDVANAVTTLESTGIVVTDVAVIDQLKIKNREYARKPAVRACLLSVVPLLVSKAFWGECPLETAAHGSEQDT